MFGIKFNNKLQMSKVKKPSRDEELMNKFDKAPKGFKAMDEETV